ncbi:unnamed protein product [Adineta ricciae]|uniref:G domain-containing protein n=1 Tax=Adineta ricciae TaxID=249248 RepID=A0A814K7X2_ADIRI|nr:unnamed protein product [Adineta ricciae]CAF1276126.1 unnamed protein product [Adineta ricciae]
MVDNLRQTNLLLCGSARVGKSTLVNAICQRKLTKTSASLNSISKSVERYSYECTDGKTVHETVIWDSPGIESWNEDDVRSYMATLIEQTQPLCMIYCASPGSFAILEHVAWLLSECYKKNIFCALVCTNMWAGKNRQVVVNEFRRLVQSVHPNIKPTEEDGVIYYRNVALVTMVNSREYVDEEFGVRKDPSGVNELIFGIAKCLNRDFMFAWFRTVSQNTSFWKKMSSKLSGLLHVPVDTFNSFREGASTFLDCLLDISSFESEYAVSNNMNNSDGRIFDDAEIIGTPQNQLKFTLHSEHLQAIHQLAQTLANLGAISSKTNTESTSVFTLTVEFDNKQRHDAIYDLCKLMSSEQIICSIENDTCCDFGSVFK